MMNRISKILLTAVLGLAFTAQMAQAQADSKAIDAAIKKFLASEEGETAIGKAAEGYFKKRQESARKEESEKEAAAMEEQFKNPVKIDIGDSPFKGPANAKVTVVEFSDFQCPFCKRGMDTMDALLKAYPNDVRVAFMNLPLPFHPQAMPAAKAALAAQKQGKFWEMHDALFNNQQQLKPEFYEAKAKELGLNMEKFKADMNDPALEARIKAEAEIANKNGIQGTPGFFVGGVAVKGAYPIEHFKSIVDRLLKGPQGK